MQITIVGAGPGISQSVAKLFGQKGYAVALVARQEEKLKAQVEELTQLRIRTMYIVADVTDEVALTTALDQISAALGKPEMVLYNASAMRIVDVLDEDWISIKSHMDVNIGGAFFVAKQVLPTMLAAGKGKLFFTGGGSALNPSPAIASLSIGKAGLRALVQALAKRVADTGVHVATVTVNGTVNPADAKYNPDAIAEQYWTLFQQQSGAFQTEIIY